MKTPGIILLLVLSFTLAGCIDEIAFDVHSDKQHLVVDGRITDSLQVQTIELKYSSVIGSISTDNIMPPVIGASVRVLDDTGGSFDFVETANGVYTREMEGEPGKAYHIEVKTPDGKTILSKPAKLSAAPQLLPATAKVVDVLTISQTGTSLIKQKLSLEMNTDVTELTDRPYLRWRAMGEYEFGEDYPGIIGRKICYIKQNLDFNNITIFDTHELTGGLLTNEPFLLTNYDYHYAYMYCFHLFQYSMSSDEYRYWDDVHDIVNIDGSIFDPPPGTVKGNLYNPDDLNERILGYFSVVGVSYIRHFTNAIELGVIAHPLCSSFDPPGQCAQCLLIPNSTTIRPDYWQP